MKGRFSIRRKAKASGIRRSQWRRSGVLYIFLLPAFFCWLLFNYVPLYGIVIAFKDYSPVLGIADSPWVGFKHFRNFFDSYYFLRLHKNTFLISFYGLVFGLPGPILLAVLFSEMRSSKLRNIYQAISYLPNFISTVLVCSFVFLLTRYDTGLINGVLKSMGMEQIGFMSDAKYFRTIFTISGIWQGVGWGSIIYYAALTNVDPGIIEAAQIDGCNRIQKIWYISLPLIKPTIVTLLLLSIGGLLSVGREKVMLLYNDATLETADVLSTFTYRAAFGGGAFSYSAAIGLFENIIRMFLLFIANAFSRKVSGESLW